MNTQTKKLPATKIPAKKDAAKQLEDLFEDSLKDIYWAEKALTKALPKMGKNATSPKLKKAIADHLAQTVEHVTRLEDCFNAIGKKAIAKKCDAMEGLLKEGEGIMKETQPGAVRDAGIIAASQKVEHYEIATYGGLAQLARTLGLKEVAEILHTTLNEEKEADESLSGIAENNINYEASEEEETLVKK